MEEKSHAKIITLYLLYQEPEIKTLKPYLTTFRIKKIAHKKQAYFFTKNNN